MLRINNYIHRIRTFCVDWISVMSTFLTFLYFFELFFGIKTITKSYEQWKDMGEERTSVKFFVGILLILTSTGFTNLASLNWEYKRGRSSAWCYVFHLFQLGILWRRSAVRNGCEWQLDSQLLATVKFIYSYFHTVPLVMFQMHDILMGETQSVGMIIVIFELLCIVISTVVCCWFYGIALSNEVCKSNDQNCGATFFIPIYNQFKDGDGADNKPEEKMINETKAKEVFVRYLMFTQMFCFLLGKLIAFATFIVISGVYSVLIFGIHFFANIAYLKQQMPYLVPESINGHKKWARFCYLSYLLLFDWHFNRDPNTAFNLCTDIREGVSYYIISVLEVIIITAIKFCIHSNLNSASNGSFNLLVIGTVLVVTSVSSQIMLVLYLQGTKESKALWFENIFSFPVISKKHLKGKFCRTRKTSFPTPTISTVGRTLNEEIPSLSKNTIASNSYLDFKDLEDNFLPHTENTEGSDQSVSHFSNVNQAEKPFEIIHQEFNMLKCNDKEITIFNCDDKVNSKINFHSLSPNKECSGLETGGTIKNSADDEWCFNRNLSFSWPHKNGAKSQLKTSQKLSSSFQNINCQDQYISSMITNVQEDSSLNEEYFSPLHSASETPKKESSTLQDVEDYI